MPPIENHVILWLPKFRVNYPGKSLSCLAKLLFLYSYLKFVFLVALRTKIVPAYSKVVFGHSS